eukprot:4600601-Amphidinium_carterae.1
MEQAMATARMNNASEDAAVSRTSSSTDAVQSAEGPKVVMKPAPTCPPKKPPGPFFASPHRSDDDEPPEHQVVMSPKPPEHWMVMSPTTPQLSDGNVPPENWETATAAAAKQAAAVIAQAKEKAFPSQPKFKPEPKGFEYVHTTGKVPSSCPVLKAILDQNEDGPLPSPPEIKPPPVRYTAAEQNALEAAKERQQQRDRMRIGSSPSTD